MGGLEKWGIHIRSIIRLSADPAGFGATPDELSAEDFNSGIPLQHTHSNYEDDELGLYVGVWDTESMVETGGRYACDEFMWLLEGECQIRNNATGKIDTVVAGTPFVIPKAYDCQWQQTGYLKKFFLISEHPDEAMPTAPSTDGVVIPQGDAALTDVAEKNPFAITSDASPRHSVCYEDTTGRFTAGTWAAEGFESPLQPFPYYEFAYVQDGSISLSDAAGRTYKFSAGDAFFIPEGVECAAKVANSVRVFFAAVKPD